jgi:hypothetical protein
VLKKERPTVATATRRLEAEEAPLAEAPHVLGTILDRDAPLGAARDQLDACLSADQKRRLVSS